MHARSAVTYAKDRAKGPDVMSKVAGPTVCAQNAADMETGAAIVSRSLVAGGGLPPELD